MSAARPTQSAVSNTISALLAAGLQPAAVHVNADGSFRVELGDFELAGQSRSMAIVNAQDGPPSWSDCS